MKLLLWLFEQWIKRSFRIAYHCCLQKDVKTESNVLLQQYDYDHQFTKTVDDTRINGLESHLIVGGTVEDALAHVPGEAVDLEPARPRALALPVRAQRAALLRADARPVQVLQSSQEKM